MINITQDIHSLTEFKKNTGDFILDLKKTGRPSVLTVNGKAEIVVMDAAVYQKIQEQLEFEKTISEVEDSLKDFEEGKFASSKKVFSNLRKKSPIISKTKK